MKIRVPTALSRTALALAVCLTAGVSQAQVSDDQADDEEAVDEAAPLASSQTWPQQFNQGGLAFTVYPPQLDRWQGDRLEGRAVVAVQSAGSGKPVFGTVSLTARTETDNATGTVSVRDITISRASFPTATDRAGSYLDAVRQHLAGLTWKVAAERLRSDLAIDQAAQQSRGQPFRNDPPRIIYTQSPTILVPVDGQPVLREMMGLDLMRVLNTRALILVDRPTGRYFLSVGGRWLEAPSIEGPWTDAQVRPIALEEAKQQAANNGQVDLLEGSEPPEGRAPRVIVSTVPTELIQTGGPPQYLPIERTQLLYVTNSPNRLFLDLPTQQYYVLLAGRWYRSRSLQQGPWEYVAGTGLPPDFALIPDTHPTETVRAAVPGTPQAQEAAIANSVPQVATVKRSAAQLELGYDGPPQFRPIEGTALESAVNAPVPVIRVDWHNYYALDNGVWFFSESPDGPWTAATWVPPVIYSIPHSSPLHYVTYVRVYDATPEDVYVGYTPGYVGSYVTVDSTVVYGTGWYYRPWIGSVWYCPPVTWGFGFSFWNTWWNPWPVRSAVWVGWRPRPFFHPWWGPWAVPVAVRPVPFHRAVPLATTGVPVNVNRWRANHFNPGNVTGIYHRWGGRTVVRNPAGARPPGGVATPAPAAGAARPARAWSGNPDWRADRQRDGQGQRSVGNGQGENGRLPGPNAQPSVGNAQGGNGRQPGPNAQRSVGNGQWENWRQPGPNARRWGQPQISSPAAAASPQPVAPPIGSPRQNPGTTMGAPAAPSRPGQSPTRISPWQGERHGSRLSAPGSPPPSGAATPFPPRGARFEAGQMRGPGVAPAFVQRQQSQPAAAFDRPRMSAPAFNSRPPPAAAMGPSRNAPAAGSARGHWQGHSEGHQMRGR